MNTSDAKKPALAATRDGLQKIDQLAGPINPTANRSTSKKQRPLGRRAGYLERQRLIALRAEKRAEKAAKALPALTAHPAPIRRGNVIRIPDAAPRQDFAQPSPSAFAVGARVFHQKFGNGIVTAIDGNKLTIRFDRAGEKRVVDSFVSAGLSESERSEIDRAREADNHFFERFPERRHRIRLASRAECKQFEIAGGVVPPDFRAYVVLAYSRDQEWLRLYVIGPVTDDIDFTEERAASIFEGWCVTIGASLFGANWLREISADGDCYE
jgi:hypothetical protein